MFTDKDGNPAGWGCVTVCFVMIIVSVWFMIWYNHNYVSRGRCPTMSAPPVEMMNAPSGLERVPKPPNAVVEEKPKTVPKKPKNAIVEEKPPVKPKPPPPPPPLESLTTKQLQIKQIELLEQILSETRNNGDILREIEEKTWN